jgi:hypothetical protein
MRLRLAGTAPILVLGCALTGPLYAQEPALSAETFTESLRTLAPSAGEVFRGIHRSALDRRPNLAALSVALPPGDAGRLCLTVETQDGRYLGQASYVIAQRVRTVQRTLRLPTAHRPLLESQLIRDVSVIAFVAESCRGGSRVYLPVSLGAPPDRDGSVTLLINSRTPGVVVRIFHVESSRYADCATDAVTERQVAFNVECRIVLPGGAQTLTVVRSRAEKVLEPEPIATYIPSP